MPVWSYHFWLTRTIIPKITESLLHIDASQSYSTIWEKPETPLELDENPGSHGLHLFSFPRGWKAARNISAGWLRICFSPRFQCTEVGAVQFKCLIFRSFYFRHSCYVSGSTNPRICFRITLRLILHVWRLCVTEVHVLSWATVYSEALGLQGLQEMLISPLPFTASRSIPKILMLLIVSLENPKWN